MESLFENSLARMFGPFFLVLYGFVILAAFLFIRYYAAHIAGKLKNQEAPMIPEQPNPYEIAFLRGGEREVILITLYALIKRGFLLLLANNDKSSIRVKMKTSHPDVKLLTLLERSVYHACKAECYLKDLILEAAKSPDFINQVNSIDAKLVKDQLIWSDDEFKKFRWMKGMIIAFVLLLGVFKLLAALAHDHTNVALLIIMSILGITWISKLTVNTSATSKGKELLEKIEQIFKPVYGAKYTGQPFYMQQLLMAIYGMDLLQGSQDVYIYNYVNTELITPKTVYMEGSSSGGSGCGSGSSCGGGCGGGCGGCS